MEPNLLPVRSRRLEPIVLLITALAVAVVRMVLEPAYTGDDSWIHFTYARNLITAHVFGFNSLTPSYGSTSPLWVLLGSLVSRVSGLDVPAAFRGFGLLLFTVNPLLLWHWLKKHPDIAPPWSALFLVFNAVLVRWTGTGMETDLCVTAALLWLLLFRPERPLRSSGLLLFCFLVRPEFALLLPIALLTGLRNDRRRTVVLGIHAVLMFGVWFAFAWKYFGTPLPLTAVKVGHAASMAATARVLKVFAGTFTLPLLLSAMFLVWGLWKQRNAIAGIRLPESVAVLLLWFGVLPFFYLLTGTTVISRYLTAALVPLLILWAALAHRLNVRRFLWLVTALVFLCWEGFLFSRIHLPSMREFSEGFQKTYTAIGQQAGAAPVSGRPLIMAADVGLIAWHSYRPVLDLCGLTSNHVRQLPGAADGRLFAHYQAGQAVMRLSQYSADSLLTAWDKESGGTVRATVRGRWEIASIGVLENEGWNVFLLEANLPLLQK